MGVPNLNSDDYYQILGCSRKDDDAALKKAYRKLAVKVCTMCDMIR
jgi:curved DNA-binding protein CbpA